MSEPTSTPDRAAECDHGITLGTSEVGVETCAECGVKLRRSVYPQLADKGPIFDENGMAGCPKGGFHQPRAEGS